MKKFSSTLLMMVILFVVSTQAANAEMLNPLYSEVSMDNFSTSSSTAPKSKLTSSFEIDYLMLEGQAAFGGSLLLGGLVFTGEYAPSNELGAGVEQMASWSAGVGLNKRVYILRFVMIEGRIGADYNNVMIKYDDGEKSDFEGSWGGFGNVRAGLKLFGNTCVTVGYKWKFNEFNLAREYTSTYVTAGLSFLF